MISTRDGNKIKQNLKNGTVTASLSQDNLTNKGTTVIPGVFYINDVVVRDNGGNSEIYIAVGVSSHRDAASHIFGVDDYGIWKSLDQGTTWIKVPAYLDGSTTLYQPMDLELDPNTNKLWFSTTNNFKGTGGGTILVSNSGVTSFVKKYTIEGARRTELEIASNGTIYALAAENPVTIIKSSDQFSSTPKIITLPNDSGIY